MSEEDDRPAAAKQAYTLGSPLDAKSVDELNELLGELRDEIVRVEQDIVKKDAVRSAAEDVFKL